MNKRRSFLRQAGFLSAGALLAPAFISCSSDNQKNTEESNEATAQANNETTTARASGIDVVGIQLYTLRELISKDVKSVIPEVAKAGYKDVETYGYSKDKGFFGIDAQAFKELLQNNNLNSSSGHYEFNSYISGNNDDIVKTYIEAGNTLGQSYITVPHLSDQLRGSADDYKSIAAKLNKAGELCKAADLKLAYHNHDFEFTTYGDTTGYDILLKETDPELVDFELDLYWAVRAGKDPVAMFKENPGRFVMWHVKDMDKSEPKLNTEVGSGSINFKEIFNAAETAGLKRIFVEQENFSSSTTPYQSITQSYNYVKENLI